MFIHERAKAAKEVHQTFQRIKVLGSSRHIKLSRNENKLIHYLSLSYGHHPSWHVRLSCFYCEKQRVKWVLLVWDVQGRRQSASLSATNPNNAEICARSDWRSLPGCCFQHVSTHLPQKDNKKWIAIYCNQHSRYKTCNCRRQHCAKNSLLMRRAASDSPDSPRAPHRESTSAGPPTHGWYLIGSMPLGLSDKVPSGKLT